MKSRGWRWLFVIVVVAGLDFAIRFITHFNLVLVLRAEAFLFLAAAGTLWWWGRRVQGGTGWWKVLHGLLVAGFTLAGVRAGLWGVGIPVAYSNIFMLAIGALLVALALYRRYRSRAGEERHDD